MLRKLSILLLGLVAFACQNSRITNNAEGLVSISLNTDSLTVITSKAAPEISDFAVRIENTRGEILREWESVSDVPKVVNMVPGSYRFVAYCGSAEGYPSWTAGEYWQGEHKFAVAAGEKVDVSIVVKIGLTKVLVYFDESFDKYYSAYSADVRTTTPATPQAEHLNYTTADHDVQGSFLPGTLRLRMRLTSKLDGKEYIYSPPTALGAARAAERHTIKLSVGATMGDPVLSVDLDGEVTKYDVVLSDLPASTLPKAAPRVRSVGFDVNDQMVGLVYNEGNAPVDKMAAAIDAAGGIKSLKITALGAALKAVWGGTPYIDVVGINKPENREMKELLVKSGFEWSEDLNLIGQAGQTKIVSRGEVRLDGIFRSLTARLEDGAQGSDYSFSIEAIDLFDQKSTNSGRFEVKTTIKPPVFDMNVPTEGNVWASTAEFELSYTANVAGAEPFVEVRKGNGPWSKYDQSYAETAVGAHYQTVRGLEPSTQYTFRAAFGAHRATEYTFTTESAADVPNGDMESWGARQLGTSTENIPFYEPWKGESKFWDTNNSYTASSRQWPVTGQTCFPAVSYTMMSNGGSFAAEIRSTGAGWGNTVNINYSNFKTAGLLFVGSYGDDGHGRAFEARPTQLQFYYTYSQYNNDSFDAQIILWSGDTQIGSGTFTSPQGQSTSAQYVKATVEVNYTNRLLRADKMTIIFRSTNKAQAETKTGAKIDLDYMPDPDYNKGWTAHIGSILRVDDVSLVY